MYKSQNFVISLCIKFKCSWLLQTRKSDIKTKGVSPNWFLLAVLGASTLINNHVKKLLNANVCAMFAHLHLSCNFVLLYY